MKSSFKPLGLAAVMAAISAGFAEPSPSKYEIRGEPRRRGRSYRLPNSAYRPKYSPVHTRKPRKFPTAPQVLAAEERRARRAAKRYANHIGCITNNPCLKGVA